MVNTKTGFKLFVFVFQTIDVNVMIFPLPNEFEVQSCLLFVCESNRTERQANILCKMFINKYAISVANKNEPKQDKKKLSQTFLITIV